MRRTNLPPKPALTQARLRELVHYDPETGAFTRLVALSNRFAIGDPVGSIWSKRARYASYLYLCVDGKRYQAHRLAWLYMTGEWPEHKVDHRDRDGLNNRWTNLRSATVSQNLQNSGISVKNTSGHKGVSWCASRGKWVAQISIKGKRTPLGRYFSKDEAIAAYRLAAERHFGEFARFE